MKKLGHSQQLFAGNRLSEYLIILDYHWSHLLKKSLVENFIFCAVPSGSSLIVYFLILHEIVKQRIKN